MISDLGLRIADSLRAAHPQSEISNPQSAAFFDNFIEFRFSVAAAWGFPESTKRGRRPPCLQPRYAVKPCVPAGPRRDYCGVGAGTQGGMIFIRLEVSGNGVQIVGSWLSSGRPSPSASWPAR